MALWYFYLLLILNPGLSLNIIFLFMKSIDLLLFAALLISIYANQVRYPVHINQIRGRFQLSHSRVVLDFYKNHENHNLKRHDLSRWHLQYKKAALNTDHVSFTLPLKIAGINYNMSMDTGSSDIFIKGQNTIGLPEIKYKSKDNYMQKKQFKIGYLDGMLQTYQQKLMVQFQQYNFTTPLLVAYTAPAQFEKVQGLIGLSFPVLASHRPTFIQTLIQNKIIQKYAFGMNLNLVEQNRSFISFGQKDPQLYQGQLFEYPIPQSSQIKINFDWIKIGNSYQMRVPKALLDTGNTCISIPYIFQNQVLHQFNTKNNKCVFQVQPHTPMFSLMICKIKNFDQLPNLILSIGGNHHIIEKQYYLRDCTQNPREISNTNYCNTYIETVKYGDNFIFLGDAFFNRFYTFFDLQQKKVGIAKNRERLTIPRILQLQQTIYDPEDWASLQNNNEIMTQAKFIQIILSLLVFFIIIPQ